MIENSWKSSGTGRLNGAIIVAQWAGYYTPPDDGLARKFKQEQIDALTQV